jgi:hypothetical protein
VVRREAYEDEADRKTAPQALALHNEPLRNSHPLLGLPTPLDLCDLKVRCRQRIQAQVQRK